MNLIGSVLAGRYEIVEEVGSGGMAIVYKAKCRILNRYVAIKVLRPDLKDDGDFVRRFNIEAQSAASLTHPNIVSIYDVGTEGELHYIVMEYVEGKTLKDYIDENGMLNWHEAVGYACQIASGLEQAHKNSIIHRDIKPHNIIMAPDGTLKITDFGIARASIQSTVTCDDTAIGSVHYVSPEQARGGYVDERSDIYSLGIVLYEMLTGKVPFDNESPVTIALMHLQTAPMPPRELNLSIPKDVEDIVLKAISKGVSSRYNSITEFKNALISVAESSPTYSTYAEKSEVDELGGTAIFTPAKPLPNIDDILYENNQTPSAKSNLIPDADTDNEIETPVVDFNFEDDEEEIYMAKPKKKKSSGKIAVIITALVASLAIIIFIWSLLGNFISDLFSGGESEKTYKIPNFTNRQYEDVISDYKNHEILVLEDPIFIEDDNEDDGFILKQEPSPDSVVSAKDGKIKITLTVNKIDKKDTSDEIKNYVGKDSESIIDELSELGIDVVENYEFNDEHAENRIIEQSVKPGTKLSKVEEIVLTISKGKKKENEKENDEKLNSEKTPDTPDPANPDNQTANQAKRKRLTVFGPTDKDKATVEIKVNGKRIKTFEMTKGSSEVVTIQSSSSSVNVEIFHDGVLVRTETVNMN